MLPIFFSLALLCYFSVSVYFFRSLKAAASDLSQNNTPTNKSKYRIRRHTSLTLLSIGMLSHAICLYPSMVSHTGALNFGLFNTVSLTTLLMLCFSLLFSSYRPIIVLNILAAPLAAFGLVLGYANTTAHATLPHTLNLTTLGTVMELHIVVSIAAYSVLLMAAMQALLLRLQNRELKHQSHHRVWVKLLPPLQTMESLLFDMIKVGFVLLSMALLLGWFGVDNIFVKSLAHKTVFSVLAWVLFAWLIFGHIRFGWRGKRAANLTLFGFAMLALGVIGTKVVLELILKR